MTALIGSLDPFYEYYDWYSYHQKLEQFFIANDIPESKHAAVLMVAVGNETFDVLRKLCHPDLPKDKTFDELCELLRKRFAPKISVFRQRSVFYAARQKDHDYGYTDKVMKYFTRLKQLSIDCNFDPANLNQILLDQFITGLDQGPIMERLCEEKETLNLDTALEIAVNIESALENLTRNLDLVTNTFRGTEQAQALCEPIKVPKKRRGRGRGGKGRKNKETTEQGEEVHSEDEASVKTTE